MADDDYLDIRPGMVKSDGAIRALVEQQRSSVIELLRSTNSVSVTLDDGDGFRHWCIYLQPDDEPQPFLLFVAVRAVRDAIAAFGVDAETVLGIIGEAIEEGIASDPD